MARRRAVKRGGKVVHRSGFEARIRADLDKRKVKYEYESRTLHLDLMAAGGRLSCSACRSKSILRRVTYTPDFLLTRSDVVLEAKGKFDARARKIALAMKEQYPLEKYRLLLQRDNKLSKSSPTRYSDWCIKHGIEFAVGETVPEAWV